MPAGLWHTYMELKNCININAEKNHEDNPHLRLAHRPVVIRA
jgi:hypothetical protein